VIDNELFLAAPTQIIAALGNLAEDGRLAHDAGVSALEFAVGYVSASVAGIVLGLTMASNETAKHGLQPWVSGFYATPVVALAPLFILWMGIGIWSKVAVVASLVVFPVALNTETGLLATSPRLIETIKSFGATPAQVFFKVSLPSAMPFVMTGLRLGIGRGLIGVVVAELFGARAGLGQLISDSAETFNMPNLFAAVAVLAISGIGLTALFTALERRLFPWTRE
jgi:NitT/TauT family transport system permease protein